MADPTFLSANWPRLVMLGPTGQFVDLAVPEGTCAPVTVTTPCREPQDQR
ncbi:hypothetical protein [Mycobacterium attenuatum]|nr:hypothetical protein [Mycobacterium attenuatum]